MIWDILFYIWFIGYLAILAGLLKVYAEGYLKPKDLASLATLGVVWPAFLSIYFVVRCL